MLAVTFSENNCTIMSSTQILIAMDVNQQCTCILMAASHACLICVCMCMRVCACVCACLLCMYVCVCAPYAAASL